MQFVTGFVLPYQVCGWFDCSTVVHERKLVMEKKKEPTILVSRACRTPDAVKMSEANWACAIPCLELDDDESSGTSYSGG